MLTSAWVSSENCSWAQIAAAVGVMLFRRAAHAVPRRRRRVLDHLFIVSPRRGMAGHSKWQNIKHTKARTDGAAQKIISRRTREITAAARAARAAGGATTLEELKADPRFAAALQAARSANVPRATLDRTIDKALGIGGEEDAEEEVVYEGVGPGGVSFIVETLTDNRNRTAAAVRSLFSKNGGTLGQDGSVSWAFDSQTRLKVAVAGGGEDDDAVEAVMDLAMGADGVEDVVDDPDGGGTVEIFVGGAFSADATALATELGAGNHSITEMEHVRRPTVLVDCEEEAHEAFLAALEDAEEVIRWHHNREGQ